MRWIGRAAALVGLLAVGLAAGGTSTVAAAVAPSAPGAVGYMSPVPVQTTGLSSVRLWDTGTAWCSMQPDPSFTGAKLTERFDSVLKPHLDKAVASGVRRVIMVVGHPAPWVYGISDSKSSPAPTRSGGMWFCPSSHGPPGSYYESALQMARLRAFGSNPAAGAYSASGPRSRFESYVRSLLAYVQSRYRDSFTRVILQTTNEMNLRASIDPALPGNVAQTYDEAGRVHALHDAVMRSIITRYYAGSAGPYRVMSSSISPGTFAQGGVFRSAPSSGQSAFTFAYLKHLNAMPGAVDYLGINAYSKPATLLRSDAMRFPTSTVRLTRAQRDELTGSYWERTSALADAIAGRVNPRFAPAAAARGFPALAAKPVIQTEANHLIVNNPGHCTLAPMEGLPRCVTTNRWLAQTDRDWLMARLLSDSIRRGFESMILFGYARDTLQVALPVESQTGAGSVPVFLATRLVGLRTQGCTSRTTLRSASGRLVTYPLVVCSFYRVANGVRAVKAKLLWFPVTTVTSGPAHPRICASATACPMTYRLVTGAGRSTMYRVDTRSVVTSGNGDNPLLVTFG